MPRLPAAERRTQLLDTAAALFAERGYSGATTAELARAAGVTEPIIYRHFESKKELFIALIDRTGADTMALWQEQIAGARDPAQRLRRIISANPMVTNRGRGVYRVIVHAMTEIEDPDILAALRRHMKALHDFVSQHIADAQSTGQVSQRFSADIIAWMLLQLGLGFGVLAPIGIGSHVRDASGAGVREIVEHLLLRD